MPTPIEYSADYDVVEEILMKAITQVDDNPPEAIAMAFALGICRMMSGEVEMEPDAEANFVTHFLEYASAYFAGENKES